jgi:TRAP-type mannitol/chloroaromatic compound transport system permease small subunit
VDKAIKTIDSISTYIGIPCAWLNIPLMLIMTYDPTMRFFFDAPTDWAFDAALYLYGTTFMMVGAYALAQNNHVRADMFYRKFPIKVQASIDLALWFVFFYPGILALIWAGFYFARMSYSFNEHSVSSPEGPIIWPMKMVIPIAGFLIALQGAAEVLRCLVALKTGHWPERFEDVQEEP